MNNSLKPVWDYCLLLSHSLFFSCWSLHPLWCLCLCHNVYTGCWDQFLCWLSQLRFWWPYSRSELLLLVVESYCDSDENTNTFCCLLEAAFEVCFQETPWIEGEKPAIRGETRKTFVHKITHSWYCVMHCHYKEEESLFDCISHNVCHTETATLHLTHPGGAVDNGCTWRPTAVMMWCDVMWCDVMWCDVMWCYTVQKQAVGDQSSLDRNTIPPLQDTVILKFW